MHKYDHVILIIEGLSDGSLLLSKCDDYIPMYIWVKDKLVLGMPKNLECITWVNT